MMYLSILINLVRLCSLAFVAILLFSEIWYSFNFKTITIVWKIY